MELPQKAFRKVIKEDDEEVFNDEELEKLLTYLSAAPDILNLGITLMFCTGCRVRELVAIKWSDVLGNSIKIRRTEITYKNDIGEIIFEIRDYPKTEAGIRKKSPHKLRKTFVSILLDNGVDKRLVQDVAGHAQISTSERNYHRNRKSDQRKEEILSELPEFKNAKLMF